MPRFSETPVSELANNPITRPLTATEGSPSSHSRTTEPDGENHPAKESGGESKAFSRAEELIRSIGTEFSRLRKENRSGAWADLEDKIAKSGDVLIASGMISSKDWVGMLIDIEQFRKAEGGTAESPGDAIAKWLSEKEPKKAKKAKVQ
jgi:hypothetical protein